MTETWAWEESSASDTPEDNTGFDNHSDIDSLGEDTDSIAEPIQWTAFKSEVRPNHSIKRPPSLFEISINSEFIADVQNRGEWTVGSIDYIVEGQESMAQTMRVDAAASPGLIPGQWDSEAWKAGADERADAVLDDLLEAMKRRFLTLVAEGALPQISEEEIIATTSDRKQLIQILRTNRSLCTQQLQRRLFEKARPTKRDLETKGIVVPGYFESHHRALAVKHKRRASTIGDMEYLLKMRPKPEELVEKGVATAEEMKDMYAAPSLETVEEKTKMPEQTHDVSILRSLLFLTIHEALKQSCLSCHQSEQQILAEMEEITENLKQLRDALDQYDATNILEFEKEEERVRNQFRILQTQLVRIGERQQQIHSKLTILHQVERDLVNLQNDYDKTLSQMRRKEEGLLNIIRRMRSQRKRAQKIMYAERSHQNWAMAKLNYTIGVARQHTDLSRRKVDRELSMIISFIYIYVFICDMHSERESVCVLIKKNEHSEEKYAEVEFQSNVKFTEELEGFLASLKHTYEKQIKVVQKHEEELETYESDLLDIQHTMVMKRRSTFKKIYSLHREVEIADTLDLGIRRVSVANATEIERERRHHSTKIQRQLTTLQSQLQQINVEVFAAKMSEIVDVQTVMSDAHLKMFFSVFVQLFCQYFIDVELIWEQLQVSPVLPPKTMEYLSEMDGIQVLKEFSSSEDLTARVNKAYRVLRILKGAIRDEENQMALQFARKMGLDLSVDILQMELRIDTNQIDAIAVFIARKITTESRMSEELISCKTEEVAMLANRRCRDVFGCILAGEQLFHSHPHSAKDAATQILKSVWRMEVLKDE